MDRLPSGRFRARRTIAGRRVHRLFDTGQEAHAWCADGWIKRKQGMAVGTSPDITLRMMRERYVKELEQRGSTPSTLSSARSHADRVIEHWGAA